MESPLVNRVAQSSIITLNLEKYYPQKEILSFDLKDYLFHGLILKEKDFREALKSHDWEQYRDKILVVFCSTDAIIPVWAYMLVSAYISGISAETYIGSAEEYIKQHYWTALSNLDYNQYLDERVVIKGCSDKPVPPLAYALVTEKLKDFAQSIMYGEPCSTVPIFKRPRVLPRKN
jgi:hypothetical protein